MTRTALDVLDVVLPQSLFEVRPASPRGVLRAVVRQYFARCPESRHSALESLQHELLALVVRECVAHDEARVVVHEGRHVQSLVASQQEREDVRLPELIGLSALEAPRWSLAVA